MEQNGSPNMPVSQSYPSPSAVAVGEGAGPFFSHQQRLSPPDDLRLAAQISRAHPAMMSTAHNGADAAMPVPPHHQHHPQQHPHPGAPTHHAPPPPPPPPHHHAHQGTNVRPSSSSPVNHFSGAGPDPTHDPALSDPNAPRKRSKVSRACDECRRKKIRCDASTESGFEQCSSCKRVGIRCLFSRVPMKRGPSKGYIKELADRLNTLENSMIPTHSSDLSYQHLGSAAASPHQAEAYSPPTAGNNDALAQPRKRAFSAVDDPVNPAYGQANPRRPSIGAWSSHETPRHLPHPASGLPTAQTPQSMQSFSDFNQSVAHRVQGSPKGTPSSLWKASVSDRPEGNGMPTEMMDAKGVDPHVEWNDAVVDCYYEHVHQVCPFLPHSKDNLRARLADCSGNVRDAFLSALGVLAASIQPNLGVGVRPSSGHESAMVKKATDLLSAAQFEGNAARSTAVNLVYLQTMMLMALECDKRGPFNGTSDFGPPRSMWLGAAVGLAYDLRLYMVVEREHYVTADVDSDEHIGRRAWWVLVMLDRWHSVSISRPIMIPDSSVFTIPEDQALLGEVAYPMSRVSMILGHMAEYFMTAHDVMSTSASHRGLMGRMLLGQLDIFRGNVDPIMHSFPFLQLVYWHVKLLIQRASPHSEIPDMLLSAQHTAATIHRLGPGGTAPGITLLRHHFAGLAVLALESLTEHDQAKDGAWSGLEVLQQALEQRCGFAPNEAPSAWDVVVRDLIVKKQDAASAPEAPMSENRRGGLQHLADLAVNERGQEGSAQQAGNNNNKHDSTGQASPTAAVGGNASSGAATASSANNAVAEGSNGNGNGGVAGSLAGLTATSLINHGFLNILAQTVKDGGAATTTTTTAAGPGTGSHSNSVTTNGTNNAHVKNNNNNNGGTSSTAITNPTATNGNVKANTNNGNNNGGAGGAAAGGGSGSGNGANGVVAAATAATATATAASNRVNPNRS